MLIGVFKCARQLITEAFATRLFELIPDAPPMTVRVELRWTEQARRDRITAEANK
jgi:hypothetical protein